MAERGQKQQSGEAVLSSLGTLPAKRSLGQDVYENLKRAIIGGDLAPGCRVVESRVAHALGISRTPVREAIHKLEREGLVYHNLSGGFFVAGFTLQDIEETFGIRSVLESYAARLATIKCQGEDLEPLDRKIAEYQQELDKGGFENLPRINTEFHDLLYGLSRSPRLISMINDLRDQINRFRRVILNREDMARVSNEDHRQMLEYIRKGDVEGVEKLVREHILRGMNVVLRELDMEDFQ